MSQSSCSANQFDEHANNYSDDVLDLQQEDDRFAMLCFDVVFIDDDIETKFQAPEWKRGRSGSAIWNWFTNDASPQKARGAICMHCKTLTKYHKKSEIAKVHLTSCVIYAHSRTA